MSNEEMFWMVYVEGTMMPGKKHRNPDAAFDEAERLSSLEGKPVYVLSAIGGYKIIPNPNPVRFSIGDLSHVTEKQRLGGNYPAPF